MVNKKYKRLGVGGFVFGGLLMNLAVGIGLVGLNPFSATILYFFGLMAFLFACFSFKNYGESKAGGFN